MTLERVSCQLCMDTIYFVGSIVNGHYVWFPLYKGTDV